MSLDQSCSSFWCAMPSIHPHTLMYTTSTYGRDQTCEEIIILIPHYTQYPRYFQETQQLIISAIFHDILMYSTLKASLESLVCFIDEPAYLQ